MTVQFIPPHGGYKDLLTFQKAEIVYDATVKFCADLLGKRDRTVDQMVQAARSGKQNIVEGSLDQQIRRLEQDFVKESGLRERMTHARLTERAKQRGYP